MKKFWRSLIRLHLNPSKNVIPNISLFSLHKINLIYHMVLTGSVLYVQTSKYFKGDGDVKSYLRFWWTLSCFCISLHLNPFKQADVVFTGDLLWLHSKRAPSLEPKRKIPCYQATKHTMKHGEEKRINCLLKWWYDGINLMVQQIDLSCNERPMQDAQPKGM